MEPNNRISLANGLQSEGMKQTQSEPTSLPPPTLLTTARLAYDLTATHWDTLNTTSNKFDIQTQTQTQTQPSGGSNNVFYSSESHVLIERMHACLLIRVVAIICARSRTTSFSPWQALPWFADLSTSTICHTLLTTTRRTSGNGNRGVGQEEWEWPVLMSDTFMSQLREYVAEIVSKYHNVPYHNFEHAYHVFISANKLLDLVLCEYDLPPLPNGTKIDDGDDQSSNEPTKKSESNGTTKDETNPTTPNPNAPQPTNNSTQYTTPPPSQNAQQPPTSPYPKKPFRPTYGIKRDPLIQLAYLFSALVHDVEHTGVSNRQLVLEGDKLAIRYNDQSVAEQHSLAVAFFTIAEPKYTCLRQLLFEHGEDGKPINSYMRFRATVIDLVLCTDIASPERVQIVKSKWKEVFAGDMHKRQTSVGWANSTTHGKQKPDLISEKIKPIVAKQRGGDLRTNMKSESSSSSLINSIGEKIKSISKRGDLKNMKSESNISLLNSFVDSRPSLRGADAMIYNHLLEKQQEYDSGSSTSSGNDVRNWTTRRQDCDNKETTLTKRKRISYSVSNTSLSLLDTEHNEKSNRISIQSNQSYDLERPRKRTSMNEKSNGISMNRNPKKRMSTPGGLRRPFHFSLGIRRTLDLDGAAIDAFRGSQTIGEIVGDPDQPNDLKEIVVLEQMMKAADISANLQCWDNMIVSSNRLLKELRISFRAGRGDNPAPGWLDNQRAFIESYALPLARRLIESGVFQEDVCQMFVNSVERNRARWEKEGSSVCVKMFADARH